MATIKRFEDIEAWQKARELVKDVYRVSGVGSFKQDFGLRDQIRRASVSIMLNIAEGFARKTDKEFAQYLVFAHGSSAEVQSALYVALDQKYISKEDFDSGYLLTEEISKMLLKLSTYLSKKSI